VNHGPFGEKNFFIPNGHWPYGARLLTTGPTRGTRRGSAARSPGGSSAAERISRDEPVAGDRDGLTTSHHVSGCADVGSQLVQRSLCLPARLVRSVLSVDLRDQGGNEVRRVDGAPAGGEVVAGRGGSERADQRVGDDLGRPGRG
jgi:hypothetical protein